LSRVLFRAFGALSFDSAPRARAVVFILALLRGRDSALLAKFSSKMVATSASL